MFAEDDDIESYIEDNTDNFTFDQSIKLLEQKNINNVSNLLNNLENRLYSPINTSTDIKLKKDDDIYNRRYMEIGYEAHYEPVSDKEIQQWQRNFKYISIKNKNNYFVNGGLNYNDNQYDNIKFKDDVIEDVNHSDLVKIDVPINDLDDDLIIVGNKIILHSIDIIDDALSTDTLQRIDSTINIYDGILEEIIEVDRSDDVIKSNSDDKLDIDKDKENYYTTLLDDKTKEFISCKFNVIWKQIILDIEPFLKDVIIEFDNLKAASEV